MAGLITHQIPLFGEQRIAHVDFNVVDISVASLLTAETLLLEDILHLRGQQQVGVSMRSLPNTSGPTGVDAGQMLLRTWEISKRERRTRK